MIKNKTILEVKMNERVYSLELDPTSPLGEVFDVLTMMKSFIVERMKDADKKEEQKPE